MIKDIKLGLSVMKYGLNYHMTILGVVFSFVSAIVLSLILPIGAIGAIIIGWVPLLVIQLLYSISVSTMVQTSSHKKRLQTTVPAIMGTGSMLIVNTICVWAQWWGYQKEINNPDPFVTITYELGEYEAGYVFTGLVIVYVTLYAAISMKHFLLGMIIMLAGCWSIKCFAGQGEINYIPMPEGVAILLSYLIVILGGIGSYVIFRITYKQNYSDATFVSLLKRAR